MYYLAKSQSLSITPPINLSLDSFVDMTKMLEILPTSEQNNPLLISKFLILSLMRMQCLKGLAMHSTSIEPTLSIER
jgi:hypothetical protein